MTKAAGQDAVVKIDNTDGGSLSDISAYVSKISGLKGWLMLPHLVS